jgi:hypothetical protein
MLKKIMIVTFLLFPAILWAGSKLELKGESIRHIGPIPRFEAVDKLSVEVSVVPPIRVVLIRHPQIVWRIESIRGTSETFDTQKGLGGTKGGIKIFTISSTPICISFSGMEHLKADGQQIEVEYAWVDLSKEDPMTADLSGRWKIPEAMNESAILPEGIKANQIDPKGGDPIIINRLGEAIRSEKYTQQEYEYWKNVIEPEKENLRLYVIVLHNKITVEPKDLAISAGAKYKDTFTITISTI